MDPVVGASYKPVSHTDHSKKQNNIVNTYKYQRRGRVQTPILIKRELRFMSWEELLNSGEGLSYTDLSHI